MEKTKTQMHCDEQEILKKSSTNAREMKYFMIVNFILLWEII